MVFFNDKLANRRMEKARKEFELLKKPTSHLSKLDIVYSFVKKDVK